MIFNHKLRRVGLYNIKLSDTSGKKEKVIYNENLPFDMDDGPTSCNNDNIIGVMRLFEMTEPYDKIEFKYIRDLLDIEK